MITNKGTPYYIKKTLNHIILKDNERQAIISLKEAIAARCKGAELIQSGLKGA